MVPPPRNDKSSDEMLRMTLTGLDDKTVDILRRACERTIEEPSSPAEFAEATRVLRVINSLDKPSELFMIPVQPEIAVEVLSGGRWISARTVR